jgi:hypothetical protein
MIRRMAEVLDSCHWAVCCGARVRSWPILLQKSAGSVGATFSGPYRCLSKKHVGVHSTDRSHHQELSQRYGDGSERRFLLKPLLASIFGASKFSTFATISALLRHPGRLRPGLLTEVKRSRRPADA